VIPVFGPDFLEIAEILIFLIGALTIIMEILADRFDRQRLTQEKILYLKKENKKE